ncbi:TetR/AcrR family transcriptional regulator [Streptomyces bungoensis]|uniref:TetR/AcrR family transcriptional regulator n=1 Tax=Streptomyces bungoensis TaxID=285568 RepID=UPI003F5523AF
MPPTGTGTATREAIRTAAARLFRDQGFARTTVRRIAADAGADPALVIRHFKSKELLFLETMHLTVDGAPLLDVAMERLGERLAELLLDLDGSARGIFLALVHGSDEPQILDRLRRTHERVLIEPLRDRLPGPDARPARTAGGLDGRGPAVRAVGGGGRGPAPGRPQGARPALRSTAPGGPDPAHVRGPGAARRADA